MARNGGLNQHDIDQVRVNGEFITAARRNLDHNSWDYLVGGGESETTLLRNRQALDEIAFRPRVLTGISEIDTGTEFLGTRLRLPVFLAPVGGLDHFDPRGAVAPLKAAERFGIMGFLSSVTVPKLDEVRAEVKSPLTFQLYVHGDEGFVNDHIDAATELGYNAFCITVDTAIYGRRERDKLKRYEPRGTNRATGQDPSYNRALDWVQMDRIRARCKLPLMIKGVATAEDAKLCVEHGIDVVYVSNHGGRQLDHGRGGAAVVPEVVEAVDGKARVIVDGGFVRASDIVKALALGADLVGMGRMYCWALAAGGEAGVYRMLEILEEEMNSVMGLLGVTTVNQLGPEYLHPAQPVRAPSVTSAFPTVELPPFSY